MHDPFKLQARYDLRTKVSLKRDDNVFMEIDISNYINRFSPFFLIYMNDICVLDISGCTSIPVVDFMDSLPACTKLKVLHMQRCTQFSELHLLQTLPQVPDLRYLNLRGCQELSFPVAHYIIGSLYKISVIDFEPKNPVVEVSDWMRLHSIFFEVTFMRSFRSKLPFGGQYTRVPEWMEEENYI